MDKKEIERQAEEVLNAIPVEEVDKQVKEAAERLHILDKAFKRAPYKLKPSVEFELKVMADPKCYKCDPKKTGYKGVSGWKHSGYTARICKCIRLSAARHDKFLDDLAAKTEELLAKKYIDKQEIEQDEEK